MSIDLAHLRNALLAELNKNWPELSAIHDDLAQEGVIRAEQIMRERAAAGKDDPPISYTLTSVRRRWTRLVNGSEPWTGSEAEPGRRTYRARTSLLPADDEGNVDTSIFDSYVSPPAPERAMDVRAAVRDLPDRDRMLTWLKFWEDRDWDNIAEVDGRTAVALGQHWRKKVCPVLREALTS